MIALNIRKSCFQDFVSYNKKPLATAIKNHDFPGVTWKRKCQNFIIDKEMDYYFLLSPFLEESPTVSTSFLNSSVFL